jgi:hypothetical protein
MSRRSRLGIVALAAASASALPLSALADSVQRALRGDGSEGFVLQGIDPFDLSGRSVSAAGDVNGDGTDDLIIGAFQSDPNGRTGCGRELRGVRADDRLSCHVRALRSVAGVAAGTGARGSCSGASTRTIARAGASAMRAI